MSQANLNQNDIVNKFKNIINSNDSTCQELTWLVKSTTSLKFMTSDLTTWKNVDATRLHKVIKLVHGASYYCLKSLEIL